MTIKEILDKFYSDETIMLGCAFYNKDNSILRLNLTKRNSYEY